MNITFFNNPDGTLDFADQEPASQVTRMHIQLETITPGTAQELLAGNLSNRPLNPRHVKFLADQMRSGAWQITGDPIKISASGRILDGQHRLLAIQQSETTQRIYVARDCEEEIFSVLDTGRNRTAGDVLAVSGRKNHNTTAAAAKLLMLHQRGVLHQYNAKGRQATHAQILDFVNSHDLDESVIKAQAWAKRCKLLVMAEWAALHYLFARQSAEQATEFLHQVYTGLKLTEGHPVFLLRQKLQAARDGRFNFSAAERMALTIKAWNALRENRKIAQLTWKNYEEFPEIV